MPVWIVDTLATVERVAGKKEEDMTLHWDLKVKFRAFGITFGTINTSGDEPIPIPIPLPAPFDKVLFNDRGVWLHVRVA